MRHFTHCYEKQPMLKLLYSHMLMNAMIQYFQLNVQHFSSTFFKFPAKLLLVWCCHGLLMQHRFDDKQSNIVTRTDISPVQIKLDWLVGPIIMKNNQLLKSLILNELHGHGIINLRHLSIVADPKSVKTH